MISIVGTLLGGISLLVFGLGFMCNPANARETMNILCQLLTRREVWIGCAVGTTLILLANKLEPLGSAYARYLWGAAITSATIYLTFLAFGPEKAPTPYLELAACLQVSMSILAGLILGGPTQVLIAHFHLFGQSTQSPTIRRLGCGRH